MCCASIRVLCIPRFIGWNTRGGLRRNGGFPNLAGARDSTNSRRRERNNCSGKPRRGPGSRARSLRFWICPDMNWNGIRLRLRALFQHNRVEDELEEEIKTHLEI